MTLELPLTLVSKVSRTLQASVRATKSPASGVAQVQDWLGEWWSYNLTFALHTRSEGRRVGAFFNRLRGAATPFLFADPSFQGSVAGAINPVGGPAAWLADQIPTSGWAAGTLIPAGTFFSIGVLSATRVYQVVEDCQVSAAGTGILTVAPRLRSAMVNNTPLTFDHPRVALRLIDPVPSDIERAEIYTFTVRAEEAL